MTIGNMKLLPPLERERIEREYWRESPTERPGAEHLANLLNKFGDARRFQLHLDRHRAHFEGKREILELGGGQGWASCMVKRTFPGARVTLTDLSEAAIASAPMWERVFATRLDRILSCRSSELPVASSSVDVAFCFAAAHHFPDPSGTLRELHRVLVDGGTAIYLYEPTTPKWLYPIAYRRVNAIRQHVPEDVIITGELCSLAEREGFSAAPMSVVDGFERGGLKSIYYVAMRAITPLQHMLPITRDFVFIKR